MDGTKSTAAVSPIVVTEAALAFAGGARGTGRRLGEQQEKQAWTTVPADKQTRAKYKTSNVSTLQERESAGHPCVEQKPNKVHGCRSPNALHMRPPKNVPQRSCAVSGSPPPKATKCNCWRGVAPPLPPTRLGRGTAWRGTALRGASGHFAARETGTHTHRVALGDGSVCHTLTVTDVGGDRAPRGKRGGNSAHRPARGALCATRRAAWAATVCADATTRGNRGSRRAAPKPATHCWAAADRGGTSPAPDAPSTPPQRGAAAGELGRVTSWLECGRHPPSDTATPRRGSCRRSQRHTLGGGHLHFWSARRAPADTSDESI